MRQWEPEPDVCKHEQAYHCCHVRVARARLKRDGHVSSTFIMQRKKVRRYGRVSRSHVLVNSLVAAGRKGNGWLFTR